MCCYMDIFSLIDYYAAQIEAAQRQQAAQRAQQQQQPQQYQDREHAAQIEAGQRQQAAQRALQQQQQQQQIVIQAQQPAQPVGIRVYFYFLFLI
jgi:FtsZ-interacting cell division protein YlmF